MSMGAMHGSSAPHAPRLHSGPKRLHDVARHLMVCPPHSWLPRLPSRLARHLGSQICSNSWSMGTAWSARRRLRAAGHCSQILASIVVSVELLARCQYDLWTLPKRYCSCSHLPGHLRYWQPQPVLLRVCVAPHSLFVVPRGAHQSCGSQPHRTGVELRSSPQTSVGDVDGEACAHSL